MVKITKDTILSKIVEQEGGEGILHKNGVPCVTCPYGAQEMNKLTVGQVAKIYGLDGDKIIKDLNSNLNKKGVNNDKN